ncbi:hypothetical protein AgCh_013868 [Apium graveolens]
MEDMEIGNSEKMEIENSEKMEIGMIVGVSSLLSSIMDDIEMQLADMDITNEENEELVFDDGVEKEFYHMDDMNWVISNGPWTFNGALLVTNVIKTGEDPIKVPLVEVDFWVQIYDLPVGYMTEVVEKQLGNFFGRFLQYDTKNNSSIWREFMRLRIRVDVRRPLKRKKKICKKKLEVGNEEVSKEWGYWLRAQPRKLAGGVTSKWLRGDGDGAWGRQGEMDSSTAGNTGFQKSDPMRAGSSRDNRERSTVPSDITGISNFGNNKVVHKGGNLNINGPEYLDLEEQYGLNLEDRKRQRSDLVEDCQISELMLTGSKYTWEKSRGTQSWVREKLDRGFATMYWWSKFPMHNLKVVRTSVSDHDALLLDLFRVNVSRKTFRFRFENVWLKDPSFTREVSEVWKTIPMTHLLPKLMEVTFFMARWRRSFFHKFREKVKKHKMNLDRLADCNDTQSVQEYIDEKEKLNILLQQEETYWKQRAKLFWLQEGDENTKFFHSSASARKKANKISFLYDNDGNKVEDQDGMCEVVKEYFNTLFTVNDNTGETQNSRGHRVVSEEQNKLLTEDFSFGEFTEAIKQMHHDKASGPDGLNPAFFQIFWSIMGQEVFKYCKDWLHTKKFPGELNCTNVVLIPKKENASCLKDLRPIALCNVLYKIIAKVLANRMKIILPFVISENQSAFVKGRSITDNVLVAFKLIHHMSLEKHGTEGEVALKLDISKSYDRVNWSFLRQRLVVMGFCETWIAWMMMCVKIVTYNFSFNESVIGPITPKKGLRQGDPLSPYLFLIYVEGLSDALDEATTSGEVSGCRICPGAPMVSHLLFADDSFLFFRATVEEAMSIKQLLVNYESCSGQSVNFQKSGVFFSANVRRDKQLEISSILGVHNDLELEQMYNNYWWRSGKVGNQKGLNWLSWKKISYAKSRGGLGFKDLYGFNIALLGKHVWSFMHDTNTLVSRLFKARYFPSSTVLKASIGNRPSFIWRGIWTAKEELSGGFRWVLGNGNDIKATKDHWLRTKKDFCVESNQFYAGRNDIVSSLFYNNERKWNQPLIRERFLKEDADAILALHIPQRDIADRVVWTVSNNGEYSAKSGYHYWVNRNFGDEVVVQSIGWKKVWHLRVPHKVKVFIWRFCRNVIPIRRRLSAGGVSVPITCPMCLRDIEHMAHLFFDCDFAGDCRHHVGLVYDWSNVEYAHDWLLEKISTATADEVAKICIVLWGVWYWRNKRVWDGKVVTAAFAMDSSFKMHSEWLEAKKKPTSTSAQIRLLVEKGDKKWYQPDMGVVKVNVDASVFPNSQNFSIGMVLRDHLGSFIAGKVMCFPIVASVLEAEVIRIREALSWIKEESFSTDLVTLESDSMLGVKAITGGKKNLLEVGDIVEDCKEELPSMLNGFFPASANVSVKLIFHGVLPSVDIMQELGIADICYHTRSWKVFDIMQELRMDDIIADVHNTS